jgi:hypothetical protein
MFFFLVPYTIDVVHSAGNSRQQLLTLGGVMFMGATNEEMVHADE